MRQVCLLSTLLHDTALTTSFKTITLIYQLSSADGRVVYCVPDYYPAVHPAPPVEPNTPPLPRGCFQNYSARLALFGIESGNDHLLPAGTTLAAEGARSVESGLAGVARGRRVYLLGDKSFMYYDDDVLIKAWAFRDFSFSLLRPDLS